MHISVFSVVVGSCCRNHSQQIIAGNDGYPEKTTWRGRGIGIGKEYMMEANANLDIVGKLT
jgi:hypothetical protein